MLYLQPNNVVIRWFLCLLLIEIINIIALFLSVRPLRHYLFLPFLRAWTTWKKLLLLAFLFGIPAKVHVLDISCSADKSYPHCSHHSLQNTFQIAARQMKQNCVRNKII